MTRITRNVCTFLYCICVILCINSVCTGLTPVYTPVSEQDFAAAEASDSNMVDGTGRISFAERFSTICYTSSVERLSNELQRNAGSIRQTSSVRLSYARFFLAAVLFTSHQLSVNRSFHTYNTTVLAQKLARCKLDYRLMNSYFSDYI